METIPAKAFLRLLHAGKATADCRVEGALILESAQKLLAKLPDNLQVETLEVRVLPEDATFPTDLVCHRLLAQFGLFKHFPKHVNVERELNLSDCKHLESLPDDLQVQNLILDHCHNLQELPPGLSLNTLSAKGCTKLKIIPPRFNVESKLDLSSCIVLQNLPENLKVGSLILDGCYNLSQLPKGLSVNFLDISRCTGLTALEESVRVQFGNLIARDCTYLTQLPPNLNLAILDVNGCKNLTSLPESTQIAAYIEIGDSGLKELPEHLRKIEIRRNGVRINYEIAFHPENITSEAVMGEANAEVRRTMLELMGYEQFFAQASADVLFEDHDAGGLRQLLRLEMSGEPEPIVVVTYQCPSTGRRYATRVPPDTLTCHQAVAWIAGFDNPDDYQLMAES